MNKGKRDKKDKTIIQKLYLKIEKKSLFILYLEIWKLN